MVLNTNPSCLLFVIVSVCMAVQTVSMELLYGGSCCVSAVHCSADASFHALLASAYTIFSVHPVPATWMAIT